MKRLLLVVLVSACGTFASPAPTTTPTAALSTAALTPTPTSSTGTTNSECTAATGTIARTEFVIERYYQLASGGSVAAITDCFARVYRERHRNFAESAQMWSAAGPAFGVVIMRLDSVNGCERFRGSATMRGSADASSLFFIIGPEGDRTRIYAAQTGLSTPELETTRCP